MRIEYKGIKIEPIGVDDFDGDGKEDAVFLVRDLFGEDKTGALCISEPDFQRLPEGYYALYMDRMRLVAVIKRSWPYHAKIERNNGECKIVVTNLREQ